MKYKTEVKTETKITVKNTAQIEFDSMLVSPDAYFSLLGKAVELGQDVDEMAKVAVVMSEYVPSDKIVLRLRGHIVAIVPMDKE
jgi:hypothetical protein